MNGRITDLSSGKIAPGTIHGDLVHRGAVARPKPRRDIDGLRAVAVVPVLLYHAGVPYFSGGFVGVDVFFVISGYLITGIIYREINAGHFSLLAFYERRARRILPALYMLLLLTFVVSWFLFLPKDLGDTGQSLVATPMFLANFLFYIKTNYFGIAAENKPLLHAWSLAVEEQFYIAFPLVLLLIMRYGRLSALFTVIILIIVSFLLSAWAAYVYPVEAFYFPFTRAWELLLGSLVAIGVQDGTWRTRSSPTLAWIGLGLISGSVFLLSRESVFPGLSALPVCCGTALLIYAGTGTEPTPVARLLSWHPLVFTGLVSYSLYLIHWPALVFAAYYNVTPLTAVQTGAILILVYAASAASWRWVEQPVRFGLVLRSRVALFLSAFAGAAIFSTIGLTLYFSGGAPSRLPENVLKVERARFDYDTEGCGQAPGARYGALCRIGWGRPSFIVWGDSHAGALRPVFERAASLTGSSGLVVSANGCAPLLGVTTRAVARQKNDCGSYNQEIVQLIETLGLKTVFMAAHWRNYESTRYERGGFAQGLTASLSALRGRTVFLVDTVPGARAEVASTLARSLLFNKPHELEFSPSEAWAHNRLSTEVFERLRVKYTFSILRPSDYLCSGNRCVVEWEGKPLYSDAHHLTPTAAPLLAPMVAPLLPPSPGFQRSSLDEINDG